MSAALIRPAREEEVDFLTRMLGWAVRWQSDELDDGVLDEPEFARYVENWGRPGDTALVAESADGTLVGAAWYRLFDVEEPGYGFVDAATPEVAIGVEPGHRGAGIGRALLETLAERARGEGFQTLSLAVEQDNPALRLYEQVGFQRVKQGKDDWTLVLLLD